MSDNGQEDYDRKIRSYLSLGFSIFGLLLLLLNFLGVSGIGFGSSPCGFVALTFACGARNAKLIVLSIFVMSSFVVIWQLTLRFGGP